MIAIPTEPVAFKESSVEKKQLAMCGATYWLDKVIYLELGGGLKFGWLNFRAKRRRNMQRRMMAKGLRARLFNSGDKGWGE